MDVDEFSENEIPPSPELAYFMSTLSHLRSAFSQIKHQNDIRKAVEAIVTTVESIKSAVSCGDSDDHYESVLRENASRTVTQEAEELILERFGSEWLAESQLSWIDNTSGDPVTALYNQLLAEEQASSEPSTSLLSEKLYECAECSYSTKSRTQIWRHSKTNGHAPKRAAKPKSIFRCSICLLECSQKSNLARHYRRCHGNEEKRFSCEHCGKMFKESEALKTHTKVHEKFKDRHKCEICKNVSFASASNRLRHLRTVHQVHKN